MRFTVACCATSRSIQLTIPSHTIGFAEHPDGTGVEGRRMANLLATKPLTTILNEAQETGEHCLKRALGPGNLIALGIGAIIGTGIFVITGTATAQHAGPAIILSFIFAAVGCVFAGLCYAEFSSMIPVAGSRSEERRV